MFMNLFAPAAVFLALMSSSVHAADITHGIPMGRPISEVPPDVWLTETFEMGTLENPQYIPQEEDVSADLFEDTAYWTAPMVTATPQTGVCAIGAFGGEMEFEKKEEFKEVLYDFTVNEVSRIADRDSSILLVDRGADGEPQGVPLTLENLYRIYDRDGVVNYSIANFKNPDILIVEASIQPEKIQFEDEEDVDYGYVALTLYQAYYKNYENCAGYLQALSDSQ